MSNVRNLVDTLIHNQYILFDYQSQCTSQKCFDFRQKRLFFDLFASFFIHTFDKTTFNLYNENTKFKGGLFMSNKNSISYRNVGDYLIPNLILPPEEANIRLDKWGMLHKDYLLKHKKVVFMTLLAEGKLWQHLAEVENQARDMFNTLVEQMKEAENVTEQLKEKNQIAWVCNMQNIEAKATEIVNSEIIFK